MGMSGGGGGEKAAEAAREKSEELRGELVASERANLDKIAHRMDVYENLFGEMERELVYEGLGILNPERIEGMEQNIRNTENSIKSLEGRIGSLSGQLSSMPTRAGSSNKYRNKGAAIGSIAGGPIGWAVGGAIGGVFGNKKDKKSRARAQASLDAARAQLSAQLAGARSALKKQQALLPKLREKLRVEVITQRDNSKLERTEHLMERSSAAIEGSFDLTELMGDQMEEGYGVDDSLNERAQVEEERELRLLEAAAEAGARNQSKGTIDDLFSAKLGAITGSELRDREVAGTLDHISNTFKSNAVAGYQRAGAIADSMVRSDIGAAGVMGSAVGQIGGAITGYGLSTLSKTPTPTTNPPINPAITTRPAVINPLP